MNECAILLNGNQVTKIVKNRKFSKILNNPNIKILEECSKEELEDKYLYWKDKYKVTEEESEEVKKYHFTNGKETITSIYPNLDHFPGINKEEWYAVD